MIPRIPSVLVFVRRRQTRKSYTTDGKDEGTHTNVSDEGILDNDEVRDRA